MWSGWTKWVLGSSVHWFTWSLSLWVHTIKHTDKPKPNGHPGFHVNSRLDRYQLCFRVSCWPATLSNTTAVKPCMSEFNQIQYDTSGNPVEVYNHVVVHPKSPPFYSHVTQGPLVIGRLSWLWIFFVFVPGIFNSTSHWGPQENSMTWQPWHFLHCPVSRQSLELIYWKHSIAAWKISYKEHVATWLIVQIVSFFAPEHSF